MALYEKLIDLCDSRIESLLLGDENVSSFGMKAIFVGGVLDEVGLAVVGIVVTVGSGNSEEGTLIGASWLDPVGSLLAFVAVRLLEGVLVTVFGTDVVVLQFPGDGWLLDFESWRGNHGRHGQSNESYDLENERKKKY